MNGAPSQRKLLITPPLKRVLFKRLENPVPSMATKVRVTGARPDR